MLDQRADAILRGQRPMILWDGSGMFPEKILWGFVVLSLFEDYERALKGLRDNKTRFLDRESLRRESRSPYFRHICGMLGLSPTAIERKLNELDRRIA